MSKAEEAKLKLEKRVAETKSEYRKLEFLWEDNGQVDEFEQDGDEHRWFREATNIWKFDDGSYLAIDWNRGLTEMQDHEGPTDIYLVEPYEVVTTKYRRVQ